MEVPRTQSKGSPDRSLTPVAAKSVGLSDAYLVVRRQPPGFVFDGELFEVEVGLEIPPNSKYSPPPDTGVVVSVDKSSAHKVQVVSREDCRISHTRRTGKLRVRLEKVDSRQSIEGSVVSITVAMRGQSQVENCYTHSITVVDAKLRVTTTAAWEDVWFKDEGGREKSIEVSVAAYDHDDQVVNETIPLRLGLYYASERPTVVSNQDVMRVLGPKTLRIDKASNPARVRYRIEDVSKNHQGQSFVVKVEASATGKYTCIAPAFTPAVSVRSKRSKRQRLSESGTKPTPATERSRTSPTVDTSAVVNVTGDTDQIRDAMKGVMSWIEDVVSGLYPLQWQLLGYSQNPDGSPDYNRPLHNMQNPNVFITRVLGSYNETTRDQLRILESSLEHAPASTATNLASRFADQNPYSPHVAFATNVSTQPVEQQGEFYTGYPTQHPLYHGSPMPQEAVTSQGARAVVSRHQRGHSESVVDTMGQGSAIESGIEYVLAKQFKSLRTGEHLGFPAYSIDREILGFFRETRGKVGPGRFVPIQEHGNDFGPFESLQAKHILEDAIAEKSNAVHARRDWGSLTSLLDHCVVYDFSKDVKGSMG